MARPSASEGKSWSLTRSGLRSHLAPGLRNAPTSSFFFVSTLMTGMFSAAQRSRKPVMCWNCSSRFGCEAPARCLGAINRSALIATDFVAVPLAADLFSRQGLRNLGPTLRRWRLDWKKRRENWADPDFDLPTGNMRPIGYLIQQHGVRLSRPVKASDRWARQMPAEYSRSVLGIETPGGPLDPRDDEHCIATVKHYRSLIPLAREARKPIFSLSAGDGALGSHAAAARDAFGDFKTLVENILQRTHHAP